MYWSSLSLGVTGDSRKETKRFSGRSGLVSIRPTFKLDEERTVSHYYLNGKLNVAAEFIGDEPTAQVWREGLITLYA